MSLVVIGAGYVGQEIAKQFRNNGGEVTCVRRHPQNAPGWRKADVTDQDSLRRLPPFKLGVYAVSPTERTEEAYVRSFVAGWRNVLETMHVERWVYISSTSVFGDAQEAWVDEATPPAPTTVTAKQVLEGEALCPDHATIVRPSGIYGPQRTRMLESAFSATAPAHNPYTNRIHRDDLARIILTLLESPARPLCVASDGTPAPRLEVLNWVRAQRGLPPFADTEPSGGKRIRSQTFADLSFRLEYPTYREGYGALLKAFHRSETPL